MIEMEMNQMKRKVLSLAMIAALCLTMLPTAGWAADAPVEYIDFDENGVQITEPKSCDQYSLVTENNTEWNASDENNGWYVVSGEVTIGKKEAPQRVTVSGDVHLILANDAKLTVNGGISVNAGNSLTVYAQPAENDKTTGSLTVENVEEGNAGIGGDVQQSGDTITINGGEITATGGTSGSGIGGGSKINGSGGTITINGGEITANGGDNGAGIGGGSASSGGIITINGGTIATTGGNLGAGIGGGDNDSGGEITINGGDKIIATGNGGGAGIGGGNYGAGGMIEINGGNITANGQGSSSACGGAGIGGGSQQSGGTITIHGGEIVATGYSGSAGIGSGFAASIGSATVINIDGGIVTATCSDDALETLGGAGIGGGGAANSSVAITPTPDDGYEVEDVIVTDEDGEGVPVTENPDGSWSYEQPESDVTIEVIFGEIAPEPSVDVSEIFLDVDPDAWYKDAVQFAYDNGLMTGTSATEFAPDVTTTRAMIVSILARLEGVTSASDAGFSDVDDEWFATAVNWAASVGVVNGFEDNTFRANDAITREQLAAILCNYAAWKGEDVSARAELSRYSDAAAISSWATDVMRWAVAENLISGVTTDELQPQGAATRAQVVAILQRFLSK